MADNKYNSGNNSPSIEHDELRNYLRNNLSEKLSKDINHAQNDDFLKDAMEGLQSFSSIKKIEKHTSQLNKTLHKSIVDRRKRHHPIRFSQIGWYILAVVIVILLILLAFAVIRLRG